MYADENQFVISYMHAQKCVKIRKMKNEIKKEKKKKKKKEQPREVRSKKKQTKGKRECYQCFRPKHCGRASNR